MAENSEQNHLFGVHFAVDTDMIDENEVKRYFSKYGEVASVKQIQYRVYVNFRSKAAAERCLQSAPNKYGEIKRGRFGPKETHNSNKGSNHNLNGHSRSDVKFKMDRFEKKERNSYSPMQLVDSTYNEGDAAGSDTKSNYSHYTEDLGTYSGTTSPRCANGRPDKNKAKDNFSPRGPRENNQQRSQMSCSSYENCPESFDELGFSSNGPPPLLSNHKQQNPTHARLSIKDTNGKTALLPTPPIHALLPTPPISALLPTPPISALLPTPPAALQMESSLFHNNTDCPPLLTAHNGSQQSSGHSHDASECPPPLLCTPKHPSLKSSKFTEQSLSSPSYEDYYRKYGNHVLIANVPEDTTPDEIEKVLYPHIPIYVSEPEVTNIRMKVLFCHVQFCSGEAACKAANQLDGVELRQHRLAMIRLNELLFNNSLF